MADDKRDLLADVEVAVSASLLKKLLQVTATAPPTLTARGNERLVTRQLDVHEYAEYLQLQEMNNT